jgi:hypothetical protein
MTGSGGRTSIPETPENESRNRGVLDRPVKPDDDRLGCLKIESANTNPRRPGLEPGPIAADAGVKPRCSPNPFRS